MYGRVLFTVVMFIFALSLMLATGSVARAEMDHSSMMDMGKSKEEPKHEIKSKTETINQYRVIKTKAMGHTILLEMPKAVEKGKSISMTLRIRNGNQPVGKLTPHIMVKNMFDQEDGHKAGDDMSDKMDMSENMDMGPKKSDLDIKGQAVGLGIYRFKWTPNVDGPFELTLMLDDKQMNDDSGMKKNGPTRNGEKFKRIDGVTVPIYVKPVPANPYVLGVFALFVISVLSYSSILRKQQKLGGLAHELA